MDAILKHRFYATVGSLLSGGLILSFQNCGQPLKTADTPSVAILENPAPPAEEQPPPSQKPPSSQPPPEEPAPLPPASELALGADMASHPPVGGTPVRVRNITELATELGRATPGTQLNLDPGTYAGALTITANGTAEHPIVIEGNGAALLSGRISLRGSYIWFHKLSLSTGADITGNHNFFTHNNFRIPVRTAFFLFQKGGQFNKVGFNLFRSMAIPAQNLTKMIAFHMSQSDTINNIAGKNLIYRNIFTSDGFTTAGPGNRSLGIYLSGVNPHLLVPSENRIEQNLFLNLDYQWAIQVKAVGTIIRQNTFLGKGVGSSQSRALIQLAHGKSNRVESNYFEDTMGVSVNEGNFGPNTIIGNKLVHSWIDANYGFESVKVQKGVLTKFYASIGNLFIKNDGLLRIGSACNVFCEHGEGAIMKADQNIVRAHEGGMVNITLGAEQTNTTIEATTAESILPAIKISPTDPKFGPAP